MGCIEKESGSSQRDLKVLFYVNILQCFFVVENVTANAVSVAIGDNGNILIFEIWWNFFYDLFSIKNVADVNQVNQGNQQGGILNTNLYKLYIKQLLNMYETTGIGYRIGNISVNRRHRINQ